MSTVRFRFDGSVAAGFDAIHRELHPGEEFDVPEHLALAFANHGACVCLDPDKLKPLRDAEAAQDQALAAERAAAGLVDTHPAAQAAAAARAATAAEPSGKASTSDASAGEAEVPDSTPELPPPASPRRSRASQTSTTSSSDSAAAAE